MRSFESNSSSAAFTVVCRSNFFPIADIDASWLLRLPHGELCCKLVRNRSGWNLLQQYITTYYPWVNEYNLDYQSWPNGLSFLPAKVLKKLLLYLGIWYFSKSIKCVICAKKINQLKMMLGEKAYGFAMGKAAHITQELPLSPAPLGTKAFNDMVSYCQLAGLILLTDEIKQLPEPMRYRLFCKLPHAWYLLLADELDKTKSAIKTTASPVTIRKIAKESIQKWSNLLLSNRES